jgi:iron complex outermembrane receptor protein
MKKILLIACMLFMSGIMYVQSGSITGKVSDAETFQVLPGANVVIKGTTSDINTQFTLGDLSPRS